eukprot:gene729-biopygen509
MSSENRAASALGRSYPGGLQPLIQRQAHRNQRARHEEAGQGLDHALHPVRGRQPPAQVDGERRAEQVKAGHPGVAGEGDETQGGLNRGDRGHQHQRRQRYKGLGEMNAEQLWDTTLNPDTRRLLPVQLGDVDFAATEGLITKLMGKGEAAARRELMELHGDAVEIDI